MVKYLNLSNTNLVCGTAVISRADVATIYVLRHAALALAVQYTAAVTNASAIQVVGITAASLAVINVSTTCLTRGAASALAIWTGSAG